MPADRGATGDEDAQATEVQKMTSIEALTKSTDDGESLQALGGSSQARTELGFSEGKVSEKMVRGGSSQ